ncbi:hypothetical protein C806_03221 [Lachnospiraceae bacterium 3-1]|nr:hypothetical protein C806_03221 [Lachnospiraceae bacterium 3-1]
MIRIAIVEDEELYVKELMEYLERYQKDYEEKFEITVYRDGDGITAGYKAQFDIILMDIQMEFVDGMTAAKEIREIDSKVVIIFITNISQYAIKGYEVGALDYILKPVSYFIFSRKFMRAIAKVKKRERKDIVIQTKRGVVRLDISNIQYIESFDHNLVFHTDGKDYISNMTMKFIEKELENFSFSRGNHCYLINLEHVDGIEDKCAVVKGKRLQISRPRRNGFMKDLTRYWGEEGRG